MNAMYGNEMPNEITGQNDVHQMRRLLGHPLAYSESVRCIVASVHGMDAASTPERFQVACHLWSAGISAEYLPHSGIMLSLLKRIRDDSSQETSTSSDWSLVELYGVCALLKIPFVVIVQPHLLRDKNSVRLRRVSFDASSSQSSAGETFVSLDNLAPAILEDAPGVDETPGMDETSDIGGTVQPSGASNRTSVNCIYVDNDCYYGIDREISKSDTPHWKAHLKAIKKVQLSAECFIEAIRQSDGGRRLPVFAVTEASFWALRDFGTTLMRRESDQSAAGAYAETAEKYPKYKRALKTLSSAIDTYMTRRGVWTSRGDSGSGKHCHHNHKSEKGSAELMTMLLYSKPDDRFDLVTLSRSHHHEDNASSSRRR